MEVVFWVVWHKKQMEYTTSLEVVAEIVQMQL
jgi:hypothetical protein